ncbi:unnamed protein product [Clonostachys rosea]|uniref:Uncharacterized protein n=1 Tax=Bionectria ochroleuca TaxID=29856 RepID=A0ABY6USV6_BIOOC|nr:unnamed protein product [Clonostachys rosea]
MSQVVRKSSAVAYTIRETGLAIVPLILFIAEEQPNRELRPNLLSPRALVIHLGVCLSTSILGKMFQMTELININVASKM